MKRPALLPSTMAELSASELDRYKRSFIDAGLPPPAELHCTCGPCGGSGRIKSYPDAPSRECALCGGSGVRVVKL